MDFQFNFWWIVLLISPTIFGTIQKFYWHKHDAPAPLAFLGVVFMFPTIVNLLFLIILIGAAVFHRTVEPLMSVGILAASNVPWYFVHTMIQECDRCRRYGWVWQGDGGMSTDTISSQEDHGGPVYETTRTTTWWHHDSCPAARSG